MNQACPSRQIHYTLIIFPPLVYFIILVLFSNLYSVAIRCQDQHHPDVLLYTALGIVFTFRHQYQCAPLDLILYFPLR